MKVNYNQNINKYTTVTCENSKKIRAIMQLHVDFANISNYNNFYFSENGDNEDYIQFWVEVNGNYAYLYYINGDHQDQLLNDGNDLDPESVTKIISSDPVSHSNVYFVTIETAIDAAIESFETKTRPTKVQRANRGRTGADTGHGFARMQPRIPGMAGFEAPAV